MSNIQVGQWSFPETVVECIFVIYAGSFDETQPLVVMCFKHGGNLVIWTDLWPSCRKSLMAFDFCYAYKNSQILC